MGYKNRTNKFGDLSVKIKDTELAQQVKDHCRRMNIGASDFVSECVKKCMEDAQAIYLQTLSKEELIDMILNKKE